MNAVRTSGQAVVLGASLAGLLAARVLADHFARVTVVDRDGLPDGVADRRGVPQGRHLHGLHPRGRVVLEELFPGITDRLIAAGAPTGDVLGAVRWQVAGHRFARSPIGLMGLFGTRPFLEGHIRAAVAALPGVDLAPRTDVLGLTGTADGARVTGVRVQRNDDGSPATAIGADLVVDATGRGSRAPLWLAALGYPSPEEERVRIDLCYATRHYRLRPAALAADLAVLTTPTVDRPRGAMLAAMEGGRHMLTAWGILGDHPPTDPAALTAFVQTLPTPDIADALRDAQPLDEPVAFRFPASVRRRYERLRRFPARLLVIGDAVCSFDPVYGQGMTVAALEALALRTLLAHGEIPSARRYFRALAPILDTPWDIAVGGDLAFPAVPGRRTTKVRVLNAYLARMQAAATRDARLAEALVRVMGLVDRPQGLLRPDRALHTLLCTRSQPTARAATGPGHRRPGRAAAAG